MASSLFHADGAHILVDGQFGSTGKGAFASYLAVQAASRGVGFNTVVSNAGPNSGHTFYLNGKKHVLKQLPTFGVVMAMLDYPISIHLSAGAVIDPQILSEEAARIPNTAIYVHPNAAVITDADKEAETRGSIAAVAGTRSGTGHAIARKVLRDPNAVWQLWKGDMPANVQTGIPPGFGRFDRTFVEVSQGFSLGLNSVFYPHVTSRECTVMQALADARIPAQRVRRVYMTTRTYPIRVGNVDGYSSGGHYPDQREIDWDEIGQEPEITTVTGRQRRLFTFSEQQFKEAVNANYPDFVFLNFLNYLPAREQEEFIRRIIGIRSDGEKWFQLIGGYGPTPEDVRWL